jgi:hypothetical protein
MFTWRGWGLGRQACDGRNRDLNSSVQLGRRALFDDEREFRAYSPQSNRFADDDFGIGDTLAVEPCAVRAIEIADAETIAFTSNFHV